MTHADEQSESESANHVERQQRMAKLARKLARLVAIAAIVVAGVAWTRQMWAWFVVPLGVAPITLAHAFGIDLFVTVLVRQGDMATSAEPANLASVAGRLAGSWALGIITAWLAGLL